MQSKTKQLIAYILKRQKASVTSLMKLAYLADLVSIKKTGKQVSDFKYIRYNYGPFDSKIYRYIEDLTNEGLITSHTEYTPSGNELVTYELEDDAELTFDMLSDEEVESIEEVLTQLEGYGARALTEIAYKTKPMIALGATLGGNENLGEELDLSAR